MPIQVDPNAFNWGNAFLQGQQQAEEGQRRNAMLDMDQRRIGLYEQQFAQQQQAQQAAAQQGQQEVAARAAMIRQLLSGRPEWAPLAEQADLLAQEPDSLDAVQNWVKMQQPAQPDYKVVGDQLLQIGPEGVSVAHTAPQRPSAVDSRPVLQEVTMPDGSIQKMWLRPGETEGPRVGAPAFSRQTQISPKDLVTARNKLNVVQLARQQLQFIKDKFEPLKGTFSAGKGGALIPSPKGEAFDKAVDLMRSTLTSLTKVPGIGAMSDYETRLDQAKFPSRGDYESTTADNLAQLDAMLNAIEVGYSDLISQGPVQAGKEPTQPARPAAPDNDPLGIRN